MGGTRTTIPLTMHAAIESIAAPALMAAPFVLGFDQAAAVVAFVLGAMLLGLALPVVAPGRGVPLSAHAGFDYGLAVVAVIAGLAIAIGTGDWSAGIFLVGFGAFQVGLTASTRFSVPAGA
jgi:hypothetical protein